MSKSFLKIADDIRVITKSLDISKNISQNGEQKDFTTSGRKIRK